MFAGIPVTLMSVFSTLNSGSCMFMTPQRYRIVTRSLNAVSGVYRK